MITPNTLFITIESFTLDVPDFLLQRSIDIFCDLSKSSNEYYTALADQVNSHINKSSLTAVPVFYFH